MNEVVVPLLVGLVVSVFALCGGRAALSGAPRWPLVIAGLGLLLAGVAVSLALPGRNVAVAVLDFVLEAKQVAVASLGIGALLGLLVGSALYRPVLPATGFLAGLAPAALYLAALFGLSALPNFEQLRVLLVAPDDGRAEAAVCTITDAGTSYYWLAGSVPGPAMTVLLGSLLPKLRQDGVRIFDLVGANTPSIAEFKRRLGAQLEEYRALTSVSRPELRWLLRLKQILSK